MDKIIEVLFNTNHEMPSGWVVVFLLVIAIVFSNLMRWLQSRKENPYSPSHFSESSPKKKSGSKKKKKK